MVAHVASERHASHKIKWSRVLVRGRAAAPNQHTRPADMTIVGLLVSKDNHIAKSLSGLHGPDRFVDAVERKACCDKLIQP